MSEVIEVTRNLTLACLLEASVFKPGNVSPSHAFHSTRYEHYLAGSVAAGLALGKLASSSPPSIGETVYEAVDQTLKSQSGGNTHLGIILLLAPLAKAAAEKPVTPDMLRSALRTILEDMDVKETEWYYKAINLAKPGGLLPVSELDVRDEGTLKEIQKKTISVKDWMKVSADTNSVSHEYVTDYELTFDIGLSYFTKMQSSDEPIHINEMVLRLYLKFLSERLDSLVLGKFDENTAKAVRVDARKLLGMYEEKDPQALAYTQKLNADYAVKKINPGMSADLTASTLFVALTMGLKL